MMRRFARLAWVLALLAAPRPAAAACYRFVYDAGFPRDPPLERYFERAQAACRRLMDALGVGPREPITIHLKGGQGVSTTVPHGNKAIDLFYARPIRGIEAPLIHETTHILADSPHPVLREGLAVVMEARYGTLRTHPTYGLPLESWMRAIRCAGLDVPIVAWESRDWREGRWVTNLIAYVESGSFVGYLIGRFGLEAVLGALEYTRNVRRVGLERIAEARFSSPLVRLEEDWLGAFDPHVSSAEEKGLCSALRKGETQRYLLGRLSGRR